MKKGRKFSGRSACTGARKITAARIKRYLEKNIHANFPNCIKVGSAEPAFNLVVTIISKDQATFSFY